MCGICGAWMPEGATAIEEEQLLRMREAMRHRGPDDAGHWISADGRVALAARRLSIIDLTPAGHQPLWNEEGTVAIVFNGECYNFGELREWLIQKGHRFRSHTDTESVLHLYEDLGSPAEMLNRLRGMYGLAIWDGPRRRLLLARDRLGIKPLYYSRQRGGLLFASEARSLLASGLVSTDLDPAGTRGYFAFGSSPAPYTPLAEVRALPPGHYLLLEDGRETLERYWSLEFREDDASPKESWTEPIRAALLDSVRRHLVADVPVGIFSSGGIDSSALVALARQVEHRQLRTYSVVFSEKAYTEVEFARRVAQAFETEHQEFPVSGEYALREMDRMVAALDLPSVDGMNTYLVSQATRAAGTIVALSGVGGDELFFGYPSFQWVPRLYAWARRASSVPGAASLARLAARRSPPGSRAARLTVLPHAAFPLPAAYFAYRGLLDSCFLTRLFQPDFAANSFDAAGYLATLAEPLPTDAGNAVSALELKAYMHNQLLRDSDAMSMAHSLELRVPFLDHPLVELLAHVPAAAKQPRGGMTKPLLLESLPAPLPAAIWRRPKRTFTLPFDVWLRNELRATAEEALLAESSPLCSICRPAALREIWDGFLNRRVHWSRVWAAVVFAGWREGITSRQ